MKNLRAALALGILCAAARAATHDVEAGSDWAVVPGLPYHLPRRGMRSVDIFQDDGDRELYLRLMREQGKLICYVPGILMSPETESSRMGQYIWGLVIPRFLKI